MTDPEHDPAWGRLLSTARRNLERTGGSLDTTISLTAPSDAERLLIIGITGVHRSAGTGRIAVRMSELDAYLRQAHGRGLQAFVGPALRNRPAERAAEAAARHTLLAAASTCRHHPEEWFQLWLSGLRHDGTITRLIRAKRDLTMALLALDALPAADEPMPAFAERLFGDTKALADSGLRTLLIRAITLWRDIDPPTNAEEERALWETVGVIPDDLASQALVLNLAAGGGLVGDWLQQAAGAAIPLRITLYQLRLHPLTIQTDRIFVTENPAVLRAACALGTSAPAMICTEGVPSAAVHRLLGQAGSAELWWRNDFDWAGVRMTAAALKRYPNAQPWRMSAEDYLSATGSGQPLLGTPIETPWDTRLSGEMKANGHAVMEERMLPVLLADLATTRGGTDVND